MGHAPRVRKSGAIRPIGAALTLALAMNKAKVRKHSKLGFLRPVDFEQALMGEASVQETVGSPEGVHGVRSLLE